MACRTVVVDRHHGVHLLLAKGADEVVGTLLHLGIGALHGVELDAARIASRLDRRHGAAAQSDAVVVAAYHHHLVALLRRAFQAVAARAVTHAAGQHDHFVVAVLLAVLRVLEGKHGTRDEGLPELISEVRRAVGGLDEDLLRRLVEPGARGEAVGRLGGRRGERGAIGCHVDCRAGYRPRTHAAAHAVAYFAARTRGRAVERFHGGGEVVCLGLDGDDAVDVGHGEVVGRGVVLRSELLDARAFGKRHVVLVGRDYLMRIFLRGFLNHREERRGHLLAVDDK